MKDAKQHMLTFHEHWKGVTLRSEEQAYLVPIETRLVELLEASTKYLFKSEFAW